MSKDSTYTSRRSRKRGGYDHGARPEAAARKQIIKPESDLQGFFNDLDLVPSSPPDSALSGSDEENQPNTFAYPTRRALAAKGERPAFEDGIIETSKHSGNSSFRDMEPAEEIGKTAAIMKDSDGRILPVTPIKNITSSRFVAKQGTPSPTSGYPRSVETPGGTTLHQDRCFGSLRFYREHRRLKPVPFPIPMTNEDENAYEERRFSAEITPKKLQATKLELAKNNGRRSVSQNTVKGCSASSHAPDDDKNTKWEWLHLIAHQFLGKAGQIPENLVAGTSHTNTEMLLIAEKHVADMVRNGKTITIDAIARMCKGSEVAETISYTITHEGSSVRLDFNAQLKEPPAAIFGKYSAKFIQKRLGSAERS